MTIAPGTSWQLMIADLSIILFLTTFSALAQSEAKPAVAPPPSPPVVAGPVAIWRADSGPPSLGEWLKTQTIDKRMRINVLGRYREGRRDAVIGQAMAVAGDPALAGRPVRLIAEPAAADGVTVTLSFDRIGS